MRTIDRVKKRFVEEVFESCLSRKPSNSIYRKKVDSDVEAKLISIACSKPPEEFSKWPLRFLADKMVELRYIKDISHETVRTVLKNELKPWKVKGWIIPAEHSSDFWQVWRMYWIFTKGLIHQIIQLYEWMSLPNN